MCWNWALSLLLLLSDPDLHLCISYFSSLAPERSALQRWLPDVTKLDADAADWALAEKMEGQARCVAWDEMGYMRMLVTLALLHLTKRKANRIFYPWLPHPHPLLCATKDDNKASSSPLLQRCRPTWRKSLISARSAVAWRPRWPRRKPRPKVSSPASGTSHILIETKSIQAHSAFSAFDQSSGSKCWQRLAALAWTSTMRPQKRPIRKLLSKWQGKKAAPCVHIAMTASPVLTRFSCHHSTAELAPALARCFNKFIRQSQADDACPCCARPFESPAALELALQVVRRHPAGWSGLVCAHNGLKCRFTLNLSHVPFRCKSASQILSARPTALLCAKRHRQTLMRERGL